LRTKCSIGFKNGWIVEKRLADTPSEGAGGRDCKPGHPFSDKQSMCVALGADHHRFVAGDVLATMAHSFATKFSNPMHSVERDSAKISRDRFCLDYSSVNSIYHIDMTLFNVVNRAFFSAFYALPD